MKKKLLVILTLLISLSLVSCLKDDNMQEVEDTNRSRNISTSNVGGTIKIPVLNYRTLHPLFTENSSVYYLNNLIYDNLFEFGDGGAIESSLVDHYEFSQDRKILSITLRDDVYFHNGKKLDSDDVLYTFGIIMENTQSPYHQIINKFLIQDENKNLNEIIKIEKFNDRNIDIYLDRPYRDLLSLLVFPILPSNEDVEFKIDEDSNIVGIEDFSPIGTGPYKVDHIEKNKNISLSINKDYHGKLPYIDNVEAILYEDPDLVELAFETKKLDLINLTSTDWNKYIDDYSVHVEKYSSNELDLLYFNLRSQIFSGDEGKLIRQAISRAINKKRIINRVYFENARESILPLPDELYKNLNLKSEIYYNVDQAKKLLEEAGYDRLNDQGILENNMGQSINIKVITNQNDPYKDIACDFIIEDLRSVGINAYRQRTDIGKNDLNIDEQDFLARNLKSDLQGENYDLALVSVNLGQAPNIETFLHSNAIGSGLNYSYYSSIEADSTLNRLKIWPASEDPSKQRDLYIELVGLLAEDVPILPICIKDYVILVDSKLEGEVNPSKSDIYKNFGSLYFLE